VRLYGTLARTILGIARSYSDLGRHFGDDLYEAEVAYLMDREWALTSDDVLWRRTKRGLHRMAHGIHDFETDAMVEVFIDPRHLMVFDQTGRAVSANLKEAA